MAAPAAPQHPLGSSSPDSPSSESTSDAASPQRRTHSSGAEAPTLPDSMRAVRTDAAGGPEGLHAVRTDLPTPGPGQLLVRAEAVGVNFIETYQRSGVYPVDYPFVPGAEAAGTVVAAGPATEEESATAGQQADTAAGAGSSFSPGQRVVTCQAERAYAEYFLVRADQAVAVPEGVESRTAAALALQGITAHYLVRSTYAVGPQDTVLFHAGAGGVGGLALQLLHGIGATVFTTVSTPEKAEIARAAGAAHVIGYDGFAEKVRELTGGQGADVAYDSVGRATFEESLTALRVRGTAVLFGGASGQVEPFDLQRLNSLGSLYVTRPSIGAYLRTPEELRWRMDELFQAVQSGDLRVRIDAEFPLEQAAAAHQYLEDRRTKGKVLLLP